MPLNVGIVGETQAAEARRASLARLGVDVTWTGATPENLPPLDVLFVAVPSAERFGVARDAARRGTSVLVEWPPAPALRDVQALGAVAEEAGVAVGTLYNHFGDRERLLGSLALRHREELAAAIEQVVAAGQSWEFRKRLEGFVIATIELFDRRRGFVRAALDSELWRIYADAVEPSGKPRVRAQLESAALDLIRAGAEQGQLLADAHDRQAAHLSGALRGILMVRARSEQPLPTAAQEASELVERFFFGVASPAQRRKRPKPGKGT